ncbi:hypothetical protein Xen7305DRAFT_00032470 [Xenococcus sp. PCC 7305]|uniref:DUF4278 domain-containing protein n=1 Tax=Xenococcus sp. PCC 7305 TaxID=102125 RepID=UPI0002ACC250|nr:DUF4278 domain-containing protein [Xenococcus sp. PCC 7305]ELS03523.1 hypothetical protein Xen7305DRAFT_00032470 [Xenococcus sp. PCC 7305]
MKLTYRGVQYSEETPQISQPATTLANKRIIYRGHSPKGKINPRFPLISYIKQLFNKSEVRPVYDPITFWYDHKREFLDDCLASENLDKLDRCWGLITKTELSQALQAKKKIKLKYRGVTYYR